MAYVDTLQFHGWEAIKKESIVVSAAAGKNNDDILFQSLGNLISHEKILVVGMELHSTTPKRATLRRTIIQGRIIVKDFFAQNCQNYWNCLICPKLLNEKQKVTQKRKSEKQYY